MCTAVTYQTKDHYFGRNLDLEFSYGESVTVTPRNYAFSFRSGKNLASHHAMIGVAYVQKGYPLYYDAVNEKGLGMAGLRFPEYAFYERVEDGGEMVAPFELIPWVLGQCENLHEARQLLEQTRLGHIDFSEALPVTPLHWMVADKTGSIVMEPLQDGLRIYENPVGVLTNAPPFPYHLSHLEQFRNLTATEPQNPLLDGLGLTPDSRGMGAVGLPGDLSSDSRFVRAAFTRLHALSGETEEEGVSQFFHILQTVAQTRGCVRLNTGNEITVYSSCCNIDKGIYYYTTYQNHRVLGVDLHQEDLDGMELVSYPMETQLHVQIQNAKSRSV